MEELNVFFGKFFLGFTAVLLIVVLCLLPGVIHYQKSLPTLLSIEATIVDITERIEKGYGDIPDMTVEDAHLRYWVNGIEYNVIGDYHPTMRVGEIRNIRVDAAKPDVIVKNPMPIFSVWCGLLVVCAFVSGCVLIPYAVKKALLRNK